ncbi:putative calcium uniporter protein [Helianthus debilis subsp. tardiflorus]
MAFKQNISQKLFNICRNKFLNQTLKSCRISSSSSAVQSMIPQNVDAVAPDPRVNSIFRRPLYLSSTMTMPKILRPSGEKLMETLKEMYIARNQIRLQTEGQLTTADAEKILRASQMEALKLKLRSNQKSHVAYDEFIQICVDECSNRDQGVDLARVLDNSGSVIVLGNIVFLKPEQVVKAINKLITGDDLPTKELNEMEHWKSEIDDKAAKMVRRELWGGLGYLVLQTAAFMRLTFWELSWDVMEPICFYVTSLYFMIGYAYFIRTSREPSFESVFQSRFRAKQTKMMKMEGFDVKKYNELMKACGSHDKLSGVSGVSPSN